MNSASSSSLTKLCPVRSTELSISVHITTQAISTATWAGACKLQAQRGVQEVPTDSTATWAEQGRPPGTRCMPSLSSQVLDIQSKARKLPTALPSCLDLITGCLIDLRLVVGGHHSKRHRAGRQALTQPACSSQLPTTPLQLLGSHPSPLPRIPDLRGSHPPPRFCRAGLPGPEWPAGLHVEARWPFRPNSWCS